MLLITNTRIFDHQDFKIIQTTALQCHITVAIHTALLHTWEQGQVCMGPKSLRAPGGRGLRHHSWARLQLKLCVAPQCRYREISHRHHPLLLAIPPTMNNIPLAGSMGTVGNRTAVYWNMTLGHTRRPLRVVHLRNLLSIHSHMTRMATPTTPIRLSILRDKTLRGVEESGRAHHGLNRNTPMYRRIQERPQSRRSPREL